MSRPKPFALRFRPTHNHPVLCSTFARYETAAQAIRKALGVDRLTHIQAGAIRTAVERHKARQAAQDAAYGSKPFGMDMAALRSRLRRETQDAIRPYTRQYRGKGLSGLYVSIGSPQVSGDAPTKWVSGRRGYGMVVTDTTFHIAVMPAWRTRVEAKGLALLDGLLTTHATPVLEADEITVYAASWVRQGAGYNLATESGFIAHHASSGTAYHATSTPVRAERALRRKLTAQAIPFEVKAQQRAERAAKQQARKAARLAS